jgi:hypothetical protein
MALHESGGRGTQEGKARNERVMLQTDNGPATETRESRLNVLDS